MFMNTLIQVLNSLNDALVRLELYNSDNFLIIAKLKSARGLLARAIELQMEEQGKNA
jgi:hypothetical protein